MFITLISLVLTTLISVPVVRRILREPQIDDALMNTSSPSELSEQNTDDEWINSLLPEESNLLSLEQVPAEEGQQAKDQSTTNEATTTAHPPKRRRRGLVQISWGKDENDDFQPGEKAKEANIQLSRVRSSNKVNQMPWHEPWQSKKPKEEISQAYTQEEPKTSNKSTETNTQKHDTKNQKQKTEEQTGHFSSRPTPTADELFEKLDPQSISPDAQENQENQEPKKKKKKKKKKKFKNNFKKKNKFKNNFTPEDQKKNKENHVVVKDDKKEQHFVHSQKNRMASLPLSNKPATKKRKSPIKMVITEAPTAVLKNDHFEVISPTQNKVSNTWRQQGNPEIKARGEQAWGGMQPLYVDFSSFFSLDALRSIEDNMLYMNAKPTYKKIKQEQVEAQPEDIEFELESQNIPEWQFLLGQVNGFLFNMKLNKNKLSHLTLTRQNSDTSMSLEIVERVKRESLPVQTMTENNYEAEVEDQADLMEFMDEDHEGIPTKEQIEDFMILEETTPIQSTNHFDISPSRHRNQSKRRESFSITEASTGISQESNSVLQRSL